MKIVIDTDSGRLMVAGPEGMRDLALFSTEGFAALSQLYHQVAAKIQPTEAPVAAELPTDEPFHLLGVVDAVHPTVVVMAGLISPQVVNSLAKSSLPKLIAVAPEFPPHLTLTDKLVLVPGELAAAETSAEVRAALPAESRTLVAVQTSIDKDLAKRELESLSEFVSVGSYLIALSSGPTAQPAFNVLGQIESPAAIMEFAMEHGEFQLEARVPGGAVWLRRVK